MSLAHWERNVIDACIAMLSQATPEARADAAALLRPVLAGEMPAPPPVVEPTPEPKKPRTSSVSVIRRNYLATDEPEVDDRGLTSGGTVPEEFWSRPDPYPKSKRERMRPRKMGRPL